MKGMQMPESNTVLLVMDYQQALVERLASESLVAAAVRAIEGARAKGVPVMFVRVAFRPGFPEVSTSNRIFGGISKGGDSMHQDNPSTQVYAALNPLDSEPIVLKRRVSAFSGSDLDVLLRAAKAENLVLAGIATSGVVLSTLRQAADLDFGLTVLEDACADSDVAVHEFLTEKIFPRMALVTSTDEWVASL
jgi:nicotinamidase-related amidase